MPRNRNASELQAEVLHYGPEDYSYRVDRSEEDEAFIGRVIEFPSLAAHGDTLEAALQEIRAAVEGALEDMRECGESIPEPINRRQYSGRLNVRMAESLHRQLTVEAEQEGVSLNQWINTKLATPVK